MPTLNENLQEHIKLRLLLYGAAKMKKTWWAGKAAEAGFNVLFLNGDNGAGILKQIAPEARKRIYILNVYDTPKRAVFAEFMTHFLKGNSFYWDEAEQKKVMQPTENSIQLNMFDLPENTVVVNDSWTALAWSIAFRYCIENTIDLSDAEKTDWDGYRWAGALATWMLQQYKKLPCHSITIGHQDNYEKRSKDGKQIEWSKLQIKSTSGPHSMQLAKDFTDIFYFTVRGAAFQIDTSVQHDRDGGSQIMPPKVYQWTDLTFAKVCEVAGIALPSADLPLLDFTPTQKEPAKNMLGGTLNQLTKEDTQSEKAVIQPPASKNAGILLKI